MKAVEVNREGRAAAEGLAGATSYREDYPMHTDQARRLVTLHDNADRALANLRNANSMSTDDPRATELLEEGGDAYAEAVKALYAEQATLVDDGEGMTPADAAAAEDGFEPGKAVWIVGEDGSCAGAGFVQAGVEGIAEGNVGVRLTTEATVAGESFPEGATISVPAASLSLDASKVPGAGETPAAA